MSNFPQQGKNKKTSLYIFAGMFITILAVTIFFVPQYIPIQPNEQTIWYFVMFALFISIITLGFHHKKLKTAHMPMMVGLVLVVVFGFLVYGAINPTQKLWILPPEQIGAFALITILGVIIFGYGLSQSWKKVNL